MKTACVGLSLLLVYGVALGGGAGKDDKKGDLAKLQGSWANELEGKKHTLKIVKNAFTFTMEAGDKEIKVKGTFKIDAKQKPRHMDMTVTDGPDDFKGKTALVIYALDGNTLKWCANKPGEEGRPKEFPDKQGEGDHLNLVFKRAK